VNSVHSLAGGTPVTLGTYPSHALVLVNTVPFGGTIINANHVVTSCRIVLNNERHLLPIAQFSIRAGSITYNEGFVTLVTAVFPHPEFDPWILTNDVAVLRTANNFPFNINIPSPPVAQAIFNERPLADGTPCFVVGFNQPTPAVTNPPLQQLEQPILNRDTVCNAVANHAGSVSETMICAGNPLTTPGICDSTIGGGIYCNGIFSGIATSGAVCGGTLNSPGIYTQLRPHIQWINTQLTRQQIPVAGPTPPPGVSAGILSTVTSTMLICLALLFTKL